MELRKKLRGDAGAVRLAGAGGEGSGRKAGEVVARAGLCGEAAWQRRRPRVARDGG